MAGEEKYKKERSETRMKSRLRQLRKIRMITTRELGEATGIHHSTITKCERGDRALTLEQAIKLADYFRVTVDFLLYRDNNKNDLRFTNDLHEEIYNLCALLKRKDLEVVKTLMHSLAKSEIGSDKTSLKNHAAES